MKKKLTIALIILLISFISYKIYSNIFLKNENNLTFYGNIDTRTVNVGFRFLGKIENITKDEGEIVKKDEVLVKLDTASLEKSLEELNEKIFASKSSYLHGLLYLKHHKKHPHFDWCQFL